MKNLTAFDVLAILGVIASAALLIGLLTLTEQMDRQQRDRETLLVSSQFRSSINAAKNSVQTMARSDDAIMHLDHAHDSAWARRTFISARSAVIWPYVIAGDGTLLSGRHPNGDVRFSFESVLIARVRQITASSNLSLSSSLIAVSSDLFWSNGRLYLLVASQFTPATNNVRLQRSRPPILAAVTPLNMFLQPHFAGTGVRGLSVKQLSGKHEDQLPLFDHHGQVIASLAWQPSRPGSDLRAITLPPLLVLVALFIGIVFHAYRRGMISARELVLSEARAQHSALHDYLTELPNRRYFVAELVRMVSRCRVTRKDLAVLMIDLDRFKAVNDLYGHQAGDELIQATASRLRSVCGHNDFCARLGGDEFVMLVPDCTYDRASSIACHVLYELSLPVQLSLADIKTAGSIGISLLHDQFGHDDLMREADLALYRAKRNGRGNYCFFEEGTSQAATQANEPKAAYASVGHVSTVARQ